MKRHALVRLLATCLAMILAVALAGCSGSSAGSNGGGTPAGATKVIEQNIAFEPSSVAVKVGDVVTFSNQDTAPHNVKIGNKMLGQQSPGQDVTWRATKDGSFAFSCVIHPSMTGQVTVGSGGTGSPAPSGGNAPPAGGYGY